MKYTVNRGSQLIGEFELADIKALMNAGVILPTDYFWFQGMPDWKQVSSLFAQEASMPPQVVVPPLPSVRAESLGQVVLTKDIGPSCPSCFSTDVIKAHAAYEASLQQHSLTAGTSSGFRLWAGGESINKVGVKCAPPFKPEKIDGGSSERMLTLIAGAVAIAFTWFGAFLLINGRTEGMILLIGIGAGGFAIISYKAWKKREAAVEAEYQSALRKHKADIADYVRTWRCNKCGIMYLV